MHPGESIGPYVIHNLLGSGGMGEVYRATDERLGREVALKRLSDASLASDVARRRVLQEARAAAGLSHSNIATIFDVLDTADGLTIVMEYVPGESLEWHVARGPIPVERALAIAVQVCDGLIEAHAHGIVHRDLKPANVQITPDGKVKILDFGIARSTTAGQASPSAPTATSPPTEAGHFFGTPGYMAPEQLAGERADARTDIYALGVLLYEMLTGRRPYDAPDRLGSALATLKGGATPVARLVPDIPAPVSALVEKAMSVKPADRFQTAEQLARELRGAQLVVATDPSFGFEPRPVSTDGVPPVSSRRAAVALVLTALAVVALTAAVWRWGLNSDGGVVSAHPSALAVLPFKNATAQAGDDPIAVGLTDAVAHRLSSLKSLRVLPLDAARDVAATSPNPAAAARSLGAGFVLEGELRRSGQTLDVDVALVSPDGERRPAGRYSGQLGQIFELQGQIAEGVIAALTRASGVADRATLKPPPTTNQQAFAEYAQARLFLERPDVPKHIDHAIQLFQSAIAKDNGFARAHAGLGQAYWTQYRQTQDPAWTTKATASILDALRIDPDQPEVLLSLAVMYHGLGRLDAAEKELRRVIALQPWNDDAYREAAGIHIDRGDWDAAVRELQRAIDLRPNYWRNHSELGYTHYRAGRMDEAVKAYTRVDELQPDSAVGFHMLGTVHQAAGRLDEALGNYSKATAIRPSASTFSNMATVYYWEGDHAKAAEAYQRAVDLAPNRPILHTNLGDAFLKLDRRDAARASYRRAVQLLRQQLAVNEDDAVNLGLMAMCLAKIGDRIEADAAATRALKVNPKDGEVLYSAAVVDALAGRTAPACSRLGEALAQGASPELVRYADELRTLKGCQAYDRIIDQPTAGSSKGAQ